MQFVVAPIVVYFTQSIAQRPNWRQTELDQLSPAMVEYLGQVVREFQEQGFEVVENLHGGGATPGVQGFQALLVNRSTNDLAVIIMTRAAVVRSALTFAIRSEFSDGTKIATGASQSPGIFPADPRTDWQNFPWVKQPAAMCEAHRRRLSTSGRTRDARFILTPGNERAYYQMEWDRGNQWHVQCGYRYLDEAAGVYRFTVKGAMLGTWKLIRPIKRMRIWLRDRAARRAWKSLGMDAYHPVAVTPANTSGNAN